MGELIEGNKKYEWADWSLTRKVESLRLMDKAIAKHGDAYGRASIWHDYGGGLRASPEETQAWREHIASDDVRYANALFCFMVCMTIDWSWIKIGK